MRLARPLGALLLLLAACASPVAATPAPTTPPPTTAAPTATVVAPARIAVVGDETFRTQTDDALALIRTSAPAYWPEVEREIRTIESVPRGSGMDVYTNTYRVGEITAYAPGYSRAQQLVWYAGTIVHDAHHSARFRANLPWTGKEAEIACLARQRDALALMDTQPGFRAYVQGLIDGADDPKNQYWNASDRHW